MGIAKDAAKYLIDLCREEKISGSSLCLGKQDLYFGFEWLQKEATRMGLALDPNVHEEISEKPDFRRARHITDKCFFRALGFQSSFSMDHSDYEGANFLHDLNDPEPPKEHQEAYSLVFDGGTFEHVFHLPNALRCAHKLLEVGGWVVHMSPSSNYVDHGFYSFSPTLFWDYYHTNNYQVKKACLVAHQREKDLPWEFYKYDPAIMETVTANGSISYGGLDSRMWLFCIAAQKVPGATCGRIPQQGHYSRIWKDVEGKPESPVIPNTILEFPRPPGKTLLTRLKESIPQLPKEFIKSILGIKPAAQAQRGKSPPPLDRIHF